MRFFHLLFLLFYISSDASTLMLSQEEQEYIRKHPVVTFSEINWEPLSIIEDTKMYGIMGDYLTLISQMSGLEFEYKPSKSWKEVLEKFTSHEIDMIPGVAEIENEQLSGILSKEYAHYKMVIVTSDQYRYLESIDELHGKIIAVPKYFTSYKYLLKKHPTITFIETKGVNEALFLVESGRADAFVGHVAVALYSISKLYLPNLKISGSTEFIYRHHILLHQEQRVLLSIINKALSAISSEKKLAIYDRWVKVKVEQRISLMLFSEILGVLFLVLLALYVRQKNLKKYNIELELLKYRMNLSLKSIHGGIWDFNVEDESVYLDANIKEILGYKEDAFPDNIEEWQKRVHPDDLERGREAFIATLRNKEIYFSNEYRLQHKDGHYVWMSGMARVLYDINEHPRRFIGIISDITEKKEQEDRIQRQKNVLYYQAHHDSLTYLPNRVLFLDRLSQATIHAQRHVKKVALLYIDLDEFKQINDSLGHDAGDRVLIKVAKRLRTLIRKEDTLARLGGDEFTIVMSSIKEASSAATLSQKILDLLREPIVIDEHKFHVSASIGISLYPDDGVSSENLLKFADTAMYRAKEDGRNNYKFYSKELTEIAFKRVELEASLREAITNEEFVVYYQIQMDAKEERIAGFEALIRWEHPTQGLVFPENFIPLAEKNGLIVEIDRFVMRRAMQQMSLWQKEGKNPGVLALNLSLKQLNTSDFFLFLQKSMQEFSFKAEWLELEILESAIMVNPEHSVKILREISAMGVRIAVDDFGTGYSSLSYLKRLPIDKLKIDKSFVDNLPDDEEDVGIVRAIIALAKSLNLTVIAEGVERVEQKEFLVEQGCRNIQGYLYSTPLPAKEAKGVMERYAL